MGKKNGSATLLASVMVLIGLSAVMALSVSSIPPVTAASASLDAVPLVIEIIGSGNATLSAFGPSTFGPSNLSYELYSFIDLSQGLTNRLGGTHSLFNPGADIDLTTTTDFEDLAAPVADVMEFTDQDRALAADSISSVLFWDLVAGFAFGASLRLILSSNLWRDIM